MNSPSINVEERLRELLFDAAGANVHAIMEVGNPVEFLHRIQLAAADVRDFIDANEDSPLGAHTFQARVLPWLLECFGERITYDRQERNERFLEESLELVQSLGMPLAHVIGMAIYVYSRPKGEPEQEVGGVTITLDALCIANNIERLQCGERELRRIWLKIPKIRSKQQDKPRGNELLPLIRQLPDKIDVDRGHEGHVFGFDSTDEAPLELPARSEVSKVECSVERNPSLFDEVIAPAILNYAEGEDELLVRRIWDDVRVAMQKANIKMYNGTGKI